MLSDGGLTSLDPVVSMGLAALGVLVGLEIKFREARERRLLAAAGLESGITILLVAGGAVLMQSGGGTPAWLFALMLGVCAASSSTPADTPADERDARVRIADLDDVLPIMVGVLAVAWVGPMTPATLTWFVARASVIAIVIAAAAWLLLTQTSSVSEQRVFVIGTLLLLGGAAAHLSLSALWIGFLAGAFWNVAGGPVRDWVARDVGYLQHPLMVMLLVVAGARLRLAHEVLALVGAYVAFRTAGKLLGGWVASAVARSLPGDFGLSLTAPGVVGVAIALNLLQAHGELAAATTLFAVVVVGTLALELLSAVAVRRADRS